MRVLITGITGFAGSHLAEYALAQGADVHGTKRWRSPLTNIEHILSQIHLHDGDLTDSAAVRRILEESKPDWIFHLAAQSFVKCSFDQPRETMNTNILSEINLLQGLREGLAGRMMVAGSSEEYGAAVKVPITEDSALLPLSPYAVSKVAQDLLAYQYHRSYHLHVIRTRAFNHEGPRRGDVFVTSTFAKQIAEIEAGVKPPILYVGNLAAVRDYTDVRDVVKAYWGLLGLGDPGEVYNIASGHCDGLWGLDATNGRDPANLRVWRISEVLDYLLSLSTRTDITIEQDPARMRPSDVPILVGDFTRCHRQTGWVPQIKFTETLRDTLAYWRRRVRSTEIADSERDAAASFGVANLNR